jgi:hypothetical protein
MWANTIIQGGKLTDLVDPSLPTDGSGVAGEVERMTLAAALCIRRSPQRRPSIANVRETNYYSELPCHSAILNLLSC